MALRDFAILDSLYRLSTPGDSEFQVATSNSYASFPGNDPSVWFGSNHCLLRDSSYRMSKTLDAQTSWVIGMNIAIDTSYTTGDQCIVSLQSASGDQISLWVLGGTDPLLSVRTGTDGATTLWTATTNTGFTLDPELLTCVEFKATINGTTGSWDLRCGGRSDRQAGQTNVNTKPQTESHADRLLFGRSSGTHRRVYLSSLYIMDGTGGADNDWIGLFAVGKLVPDANGSNSSFSLSTGTTHYGCVDDSIWNPIYTDYNYSATVGNLETVGVNSLPASTNSIVAVKVHARLGKSDTGTKTATIAIRTNSTNYALESPEVLSLSTTTSVAATRINKIFRKNPVTTNDWTEAEITALEIGAKVVA